jgi:U3 small nucleolar RNA-associated protein 25
VTDGDFLIVCSSYLDFIRLKNYFDDVREDYVGLSEHTENTVTALKNYQKQNARYLLYTERHFYFNGISPKSFPINHVIFYTLPENGFMYTSFATKCIAKRKTYPAAKLISLYTKFDALKLERILGTEKSVSLIKSKQSKHTIE